MKHFLRKTLQLNLFIVGVGNVGGKLLEQISKQYKYLIDVLKLRIRSDGNYLTQKNIFK